MVFVLLILKVPIDRDTFYTTVVHDWVGVKEYFYIWESSV